MEINNLINSFFIGKFEKCFIIGHWFIIMSYGTLEIPCKYLIVKKFHMLSFPESL